MLIESLVLGVAVAIARGVRVQDFARVNLFGFALIWLVAALRVSIRLFPAFSFIAFPASLAALAVFALINHRVPGMILLAIGITSNLGASVMSGGKMPVTQLITSASSLTSPQMLTHVPAKGSLITRLLGDSIVIGHPYPWPMAISLGDVILTMGIIQFALSLEASK